MEKNFEAAEIQDDSQKDSQEDYQEEAHRELYHVAFTWPTIEEYTDWGKESSAEM